MSTEAFIAYFIPFGVGLAAGLIALREAALKYKGFGIFICWLSLLAAVTALGSLIFWIATADYRNYRWHDQSGLGALEGIIYALATISCLLGVIVAGIVFAIRSTASENQSNSVSNSRTERVGTKN